MPGRRLGGLGRVHHLGWGVDELEEPGRRAIRAVEQLCRQREGRDGLEARHRRERDHGEEDAVEPAAGHERDRDRQQGDRREAREEGDERGVQPAHGRQALAGAVELATGSEDAVAVATVLAEDEEVRHAAHLVDQERAEARRGRRSHPRPPPG